MEKLPAVGFIHVIYWQFEISFSTSFCLSYLQKTIKNTVQIVQTSLRQACVSPVVIVQVLTYERVRLDGPINVHLGHVEVIYEVDESLCGRGSKFSTCFLL